MLVLKAENDFVQAGAMLRVEAGGELANVEGVTRHAGANACADMPCSRPSMIIRKALSSEPLASAPQADCDDPLALRVLEAPIGA